MAGLGGAWDKARGAAMGAMDGFRQSREARDRLAAESAMWDEVNGGGSTGKPNLRGNPMPTAAAGAEKGALSLGSKLARGGRLLGTAGLVTEAAPYIARVAGTVGAGVANAAGRILGTPEEDITPAYKTGQRLEGMVRSIPDEVGKFFGYGVDGPATLGSKPVAPPAMTNSGISKSPATAPQSGSVSSSFPARGSGYVVHNDTGRRYDLRSRPGFGEFGYDSAPAWDAIHKQNDARYEDRRDRAWAALGIQASRAQADYAKNRFDMDEKLANRVNERINFYSSETKVGADGKEVTGVNQEKARALQDFVANALQSSDGQVSAFLRTNPLVLDRVMNHVAHQQATAADLNELAKNPSMLRRLLNAVGVTDADLTTSGDMRLTPTGPATLKDAFVETGVSAGDWLRGAPVVQASTGQKAAIKNVTRNDVQNTEDYIGRLGLRN